MTSINVWPLKYYSYKVLKSRQDIEKASTSNWTVIRSIEIPLLIHVSHRSFQVYSGHSHIIECLQFLGGGENPCVKIEADDITITFTVVYKTNCRIFKIEFIDFMENTAKYCCLQCLCTLMNCLPQELVTVQSKKLATSPVVLIPPNEVKFEEDTSIRHAKVKDKHENFHICQRLPLAIEIERCLMDPNFPTFVNAVEEYLNDINSI
ncbi:hypothetical protein CHUAL_000805 [Chamberlinius hualienensis]